MPNLEKNRLCSWRRLTAILSAIIGLMIINACGGSGGGDAGVTPPADPPVPPLDGPPAAVAATVIEDTYVEHDISPDEISEDVHGRPILRTSVKIVFHDDTTVGEVNDLLIEFSADIIATLAGYPAVVVRIPDPVTLQALDTLVADLESRGTVRSVLKSYRPQAESLPPNIHAFIFNNATQSDPFLTGGFGQVDHHLAVRGAAAWGLQSRIANKPKVLIMDYFGAGDADTAIFDIERITGASDFGFELVSTSPLCQVPPANQPFVCKEPNHHGYAMTSIIASEHSPANKQEPSHFRTTGMVPGGVQLGVVDRKRGGTQADYALFATKFKDAANSSVGTVIANLSIGDFCAGSMHTDKCQEKANLEKAVLEFIRNVRHADVEKRVLFVVAGGNRLQVDGGGWKGPVDAATRSQWTASTLVKDWTDPVTLQPVPSLTNVLVVENADIKDRSFNADPPFDPGCIHESSFVGGHVAGVGMDVFWMEAPKLNVNEIADIAVEKRNGGTSAAAAQVSGIAAYLAGIRSDLTPQQLITILTATAEPLPGQGSECTSFPTSAPAVDAYAAVLATDPPHQFAAASARARLELLDIFPDDVRDGDGVFDIQDLRLWIAKLTDPNLSDEETYYSRFDVNGDGVAGGTGADRFDLDISMNPMGAGDSPFDVAQYDFLGEQVTYFEDSVTDMQIVCYYANTDLYDHTGAEPSLRDDELEKVSDLCDPCLVSAAPASGGTTVGLASAQAIAPADTCEEAQMSVDYPAVVNNFAPMVISLTNSQGPIAGANVKLTITFPDDNPNFVQIVNESTDSNGIAEAHVSMQGARRIVIDIEARDGNSEGPVLAEKTVSARARFFGTYEGTATTRHGGVTSPPFAFTFGLGAGRKDGTLIPPGPSEATAGSSAPIESFDVTFSGSDFAGGHVINPPTNPNFISITGTASASTASGVVRVELAPGNEAVTTFTVQCADVCIVNGQ